MDFDSMPSDPQAAPEASQASAQALPNFDSMSSDAQPPSFDDMPDQSQQAQAKPESQTDYESPGQQAITALEGASQGLAGPLATLAETHILGVKPEDIAARAAANPWTHGIAEGATIAGSLLTGVGEAGLIAKGAGKLVPEALPALGNVFGGIGSAVIKGALETSALQASDELTKSMLGQGDPETPVSSALANIGMAGLLGGATGGIFNAVGQGAQKGLAAIENAKLGDKANMLRTGMGMAHQANAEGIAPKDVPAYVKAQLKQMGMEAYYNDFKPGIEYYQKGGTKLMNKAVDFATDMSVGKVVGGVFGNSAGNAASILTQKHLTPLVEKVLEKPLIGINKYAAPAILYALSKGQTSGLFNVLNYATQMAKGAKLVNNGVESLFKAGTQQLVNHSDKDIQDVKDYIDDGGITKEMQDSLMPQEGLPGFAKGGQVPANPDNGSLASLYPQQTQMMTAAKARISNYLTGLKPQDSPQKLPYDTSASTTEQDKEYHRAVMMAVSPLSVLKHVKDGTLLPEHLKHLDSMYPELAQHLQKKINARMIQGHLDDEKPSPKTRQAMALFLGAPLETYQTPQGIMAAQSAFLPRQTPQQGQQQGKTKKGTSTLGKDNKSYKTTTQAAESDRSDRD